jgi:hypothetical protein
MPGHSRSKDGVASLANAPGVTDKKKDRAQQHGATRGDRVMADDTYRLHGAPEKTDDADL